jgi:hypothetical protein
MTAVITFFLDRKSAGCGWRLISRTEDGADLMARAESVASDEAAAWDQLTLLAHAGSARLVHHGDGHWQWMLLTRDVAVAASPAIYRDRLSCQEAFGDAQRAAAAVLRGRGSLHSADPRAREFCADVP